MTEIHWRGAFPALSTKFSADRPIMLYNNQVEQVLQQAPALHPSL